MAATERVVMFQSCLNSSPNTELFPEKSLRRSVDMSENVSFWINMSHASYLLAIPN